MKKNNAFQFLNGLAYAGSLPKCALHAVHILKPKLHKVFNAVVLLLVEPVHINIRNKMFPIPLCTPTGFAMLPPSHKKNAQPAKCFAL